MTTPATDGLETAVEGSSDSVTTLAHWLGYTLAPAVLAGANSAGAARRDALADWQGAAGDAFAGRIQAGARRGDDLNVAIVALAREIDAYGQALRIAHERMSGIRTTAGTAGLTVTGTVIEPPAPCPADPGPPELDWRTLQPTPSAVIRRASFDAQQGRAAAYEVAAGDTAFARDQLAEARAKLEDKYRGLQGLEWAFNSAEIAGGAVAGAMLFNADALRKSALRLRGDAATLIARANPATGARLFYDDLDRAALLRRGADGLDARAANLAQRGRVLNSPLRLGGALAIAGVGYDIYRGKDPTQAAAVGGGAFLASVGAGAMVGSLIPVPGLGTAAGALVGVGVGVFASGALDSMFENGPDVGTAFNAGVDAVTDTGKAVGGAVVGVAKGIGGLF